jgi:hypothetical protein
VRFVETDAGPGKAGANQGAGFFVVFADAASEYDQVDAFKY